VRGILAALLAKVLPQERKRVGDAALLSLAVQ
jgi:hypothetical protein